MPQMATRVPSQKVAAGALAGALTTIAIWAIKTFAHQDIPGEVAAAITTVLTFIVSYIVPPAERDRVA